MNDHLRAHEQSRLAHERSREAHELSERVVKAHEETIVKLDEPETVKK
jgi:hypothetical protein